MIHSNFKYRLLRLLSTITTGFYFFISNTKISSAAVYDGGGITEGITAAQNTGVGGSKDLKDVISNIAVEIIKYTALLATIVIIIGGIWLVVGIGSDQARDKAKNIILYTLIGIILISIAGAIVSFIRSIV